MCSTFTTAPYPNKYFAGGNLLIRDIEAIHLAKTLLSATGLPHPLRLDPVIYFYLAD